MSKKWNGLGTLRVAKNGKRKLVLDSRIATITYTDGSVYTPDKFRTAICRDAVESAQNLAERGIIDADELAKKLAFIDEKSIKLDVVIPPTDDN